MPVVIPAMEEHRRAIVFGGRDFTDRDWLFRIMDAHHAARPFDCIIQGGQVSTDPAESNLPWDERKKWGADWFAREWALSRGVPMIEEKARWRTEGKAAGPLRNQRMIDKHVPTEGIGFPGGRGSADMLRRIKAAGLEWINHSTPPTTEDQSNG